MRLVAKTDPEAQNYHVSLNGHEVTYAIAADDEEGWVDIISTADGETHYADAFRLSREDGRMVVRAYGEVKFIQKATGE